MPSKHIHVPGQSLVDISSWVVATRTRWNLKLSEFKFTALAVSVT